MFRSFPKDNNRMQHKESQRGTRNKTNRTKPIQAHIVTTEPMQEKRNKRLKGDKNYKQITMCIQHKWPTNFLL